ncbi:MAG: hypothetical protein LJF15_12280 [Acidobacteria bacterium]|jgi:hypothetical protein|nr:hypothetical protein [Acidobacteriota bacterium]
MHPLVAVSYFFVGLGLFFAGLGVLLWGTGKMKHGEAAKGEIELKERQHNYERTKGSTGPPTP